MTVFESLKSYRGIVFRLEQHLDRLFESAKTSGLRLPKTRSELTREVTECAKRFPHQDMFLRLGVDSKSSRLIALSRQRPPAIYEKGVQLRTVVTRRNSVNASPPQVKGNDFFNQVLAWIDGRGEGFDVILMDANGYLAESTIWNFFVVKAGRLITPDVGILSGVTRQFVIECAQKERIPVLETFLTRHDFWNSDEAFLTNTSGEIVPIASLDGRTIGRMVPGEITKRLMIRFQSQLLKELKSYENKKSHHQCI